MPKRYTDAEVSTIVQECLELRDSVKQMVINQRDYIKEMEGMRKRNAELFKQVGDLQKELLESQNNFTQEVDKKVDIMVDEIRQIKPELDWIKNEGEKLVNFIPQDRNDLGFIKMLKKSDPAYLSDLLKILEEGHDRVHGRRPRYDEGRWSASAEPRRDITFDPLEVMRMYPLTQPPTPKVVSVEDVEKAMANLKMDEDKLSEIIPEESTTTPKSLRNFIDEYKKPKNKE